jgi:hypothetical protein
MGGMKRLLGDEPGPAPSRSFEPKNDLEKCKRRKYKTEQSAINSSFAMERETGRLMTTPEFCYKCRAWHMRFK